MTPRYGVYAARVKPDFEPLMFKPSATLEKAIGLMDAMMRWFGKRDNFYVIEDLRTREPVCCERDLMSTELFFPSHLLFFLVHPPALLNRQQFL